jgi:hypothetical protein
MSEKDSNPSSVPAPRQSNDLAGSGGLKAGSLIEQSLARLSEAQAQNLVDKAAHEGLRLEAKAREQNLDYVVGKKAIEDHIDTFEALDKRGRTTRHNVTSDVKTGAGNMHIESKSGATCFVASTAYDDPNHPDVMLLRQFRDEVLTTSARGRAFIAWYWKTGPKLARAIGWSPALRQVARMALAPIVAGVRNKMGTRNRQT